MGTALVSGAPGRAGEVALALEGLGYTVTTVDDPGEVAARPPAEATLDCYVQLAVAGRHEEGNAVEQVKRFLFHGLMARFDAVSAVLPALRPGARMVLVGGNHPADHIPDDRRARRGLLQVLGAAVAAERPADGVRVSVLDDRRSPAAIAEVAAGRRHATEVVPLADLGPDLDYADWRLEVLSIVSGR